MSHDQLSDSGYVLRGRAAKRVLDRGPDVRVSRGKHPAHGVGAQAARNYCACGAKKLKGQCPRCAA